MDVKILHKKGDVLTFSLDGASVAFANALRRIMISEVPTLAIEWVDFHDNTSALFDEAVAQRLSLIPLRFDPEKLNLTGECTCEGKGCPSCQVVFALEANGPAKVSSGMLKSSNREAAPTSPDFPIVELLKGQHLKIEAVARLGIGTTHAKFQAANAVYQMEHSLEYPKDLDLAKALRVGKDSVEQKGSKLVLADSMKADLSKALEQLGVRAVADPTRFLFRVETISGLEPADIVRKAAEALGAKATAFKKEIDKI
ncbi:MAG TPA: DNA-directed RNA polymerase subunit D [archaeon]|nr:DNA-directed RNA polymerase subunit D [archaeon]